MRPTPTPTTSRTLDVGGATWRADHMTNGQWWVHDASDELKIVLVPIEHFAGDQTVVTWKIMGTRGKLGYLEWLDQSRRWVAFLGAIRTMVTLGRRERFDDVLTELVKAVAPA